MDGWVEYLVQSYPWLWYQIACNWLIKEIYLRVGIITALRIVDENRNGLIDSIRVFIGGGSIQL